MVQPANILTAPGESARTEAVRVQRANLVVPGLQCAGCIARVERALLDCAGVRAARVNLSARRVRVEWDSAKTSEDKLIAAVEVAGFEARALDLGDHHTASEVDQSRILLRSLAVAGFAAGNVMLLSVSVWSGAEAATRDLLHWLSALIALPAVVYAGRPFFNSAWMALSRRRLNMDVPISLAVILAAAMSLAETIRGAEHAYFDAAVMLLFFLLAGRTLDNMMRNRARSALTELVALKASGATVVDETGQRSWRPMADIAAGMRIMVSPGEKVPVDGRIVEGYSDLDRSLVTGEAAPDPVGPGAPVEAGTMNLTGPLKIEVIAAGDDTVLAEIVDLMTAAEQGRARYVRLADRAARIYAPLVHLAALTTFCGWLWWDGNLNHALLTAIAVLIITCPCALGLAVPAVQVVAAGKLLRKGVLVKDGAALERLAEIDTVIFDKTGTLTTGKPRLCAMDAMSSEDLAIAAGLAQESAHPLARALSVTLQDRGLKPAEIDAVTEHPGHGLEGKCNDQLVRLGNRKWCGTLEPKTDDVHRGPELCLCIAGKPPRVFALEDDLRSDAAETVAALRARGLRIMLLSGDRDSAVAAAARQAGIAEFQAGWKPLDKAAFVQSLQAAGHKVLMVGDGINDAPALGSAHASMAPSTAADIAGTTAGLVFLGSRLHVIVEAISTAASARRLVRQNFAFAALYNLLAVPVAIVGLATPLVAALAMSGSSLVVTINALRLRLNPLTIGRSK